ncbi:family 16 glycosylhydrolase [Novosphingobium cyanobacteriorum]|uniref:Family 16 glycosylhydrolase n=1 Tax=Novosphingobium cyanobacteriorum TaxID=3024215 RepID=A0ABT6CPF6_9SPHN|nr:family 16 glycosylhydrolase [Novosphingobium cyanobacteriorum]MDF8334980.1 family 16 glycosylhydrolase [Novosphingobium cyanobacteriorum]
MALPVSGSPTTTFAATTDGQLLKGTSGNDALIAYGKPGTGLGTLVGGAGDDTYTVFSTKVRILEDTGEGIDSVKAYWTYALPDDVENLTLMGKGPNSAIGNDLDNIIVGGVGKNVIDGGAGNDELTGGGGNDTFFVQGIDTITDFSAGDKVNLQAFGKFTAYWQIRSALKQVGADTVLTIDPANKVIFQNTLVTSLTSSSFVYSNPVKLYKNVFADEFNTFKLNLGTGSTENWYPLFPRTGLAGHTTVDHGSVQYFTYPEDTGTYGQPIGINPFSLKDGVLTISMNKVTPEDSAKIYGYDYTSGNIDSIGSFHQTYGYFEARVKLAAGQGLHDAFWLLPMDGTWPPELDIVEQRGKDPTHVIGGVHSGEMSTAGLFTIPTATTEFHTYGLDWEPDFLTWYIDGVPVRTLPTPAGLDKPMYMLLNLGGGSPWAGDPDSTTPFPAQMQIDYVRVYASENTVEKGLPFNTVGTSGDDMLYGTILNDTLDGAAGYDELYGGVGNDTLIGSGTDRLDGGFGDDTYIVTSGDETISEGGDKGIDVVKTANASYTLGLNLENLVYTGSGAFNGAGNSEDNLITGGNFGNTLSGGAGNDVLKAGLGEDTLNGGEGDDVEYGYAGDDTLRGHEGNDSLFGGDGADLLKGDIGNDVLDGGAGDDLLMGEEDQDTLVGGAGNDKLDGGTGADIMKGGTGDDSYVVENAGDVVIENGGEGRDVVRVLIDRYALSGNVENLSYGGSGNFTGTGNALANAISGGSGNDTLDGGAGADVLSGGGGDDVFLFQAGQAHGDKVTGFTGAGVAGGDRLVFIGYGNSATLTQVDNSDYYTITADAAHGGFSETIQISNVKNLGSGDYQFNSSAAGNLAPTRILASQLDIEETAARGTVVGTLTAVDPDANDSSTFKLLDSAGGRFALDGSDIVLVGPVDYELQASHQIKVQATDSAGNVLVASFTVTIDNVTVGDTKSGTAGADYFTYEPDLTYDRVDGLAGDDTFTLAATTVELGADGSDAVFSLPASSTGSSLLALPDVAFGLANVEHAVITANRLTVSGSLADTALAMGELTVSGTSGSDRIDAFQAGVRTVIDGGSGNDTLKGGTLDDFLYGGSGSDKLYGGGGADIMAGGAGSDIYYLDDPADVVIEKAGEGTDRVSSKFSYTLGDNVENLTLSGTFSVDGTGNELGNVILGNKGDNIIDGAGGADTLIGGAGDDTFVLRFGEADGDGITDFAGAGLSGGDFLKFVGFAAGSTLEQLDGSDFYEIHSSNGALMATIQIDNVFNLDKGDYIFA